MLWRVHADLIFDDYDEANDFMHDCELAQAKSVTINPGALNEEKGRSYFEACYHDMSDLAPCTLIRECTAP